MDFPCIQVTHFQEKTDGMTMIFLRQREVRQLGGLSAAQRAEALETLTRIERILRQVPELANPVGYEIHPVVLGGAQPLGPEGAPIRAGVAPAGPAGLSLLVALQEDQDGRFQITGQDELQSWAVETKEPDVYSTPDGRRVLMVDFSHLGD